jgi:hypothetical protein
MKTLILRLIMRMKSSRAQGFRLAARLPSVNLHAVPR